MIVESGAFREGPGGLAGSGGLNWYEDYAPTCPELRAIVAKVVQSTKPSASGWRSEVDECRDLLTRWLAAEIPGEFDPGTDEAALTEQANLLMSIEGTGSYVDAYVDTAGADSCGPHSGDREARLRGIHLYGSGFAAMLARHGMVGKIPVYRALIAEMKTSTRLQSVSWNPAHMARTRAQYLYRAEIAPSVVAGISVGREFHPVAAVPIEEWTLISSPTLLGHEHG